MKRALATISIVSASLFSVALPSLAATTSTHAVPAPKPVAPVLPKCLIATANIDYNRMVTKAKADAAWEQSNAQLDAKLRNFDTDRDMFADRLRAAAGSRSAQALITIAPYNDKKFASFARQYTRNVQQAYAEYKQGVDAAKKFEANAIQQATDARLAAISNALARRLTLLKQELEDWKVLACKGGQANNEQDAAAAVSLIAMDNTLSDADRSSTADFRATITAANNSFSDALSSVKVTRTRRIAEAARVFNGDVERSKGDFDKHRAGK